MSFSIGIVGLPNVGKSTLFKALTRQQVNIANYPFCTINPNVGVVKVPDERLEKLIKVTHSQQLIPTTIEFVDIAGLVKGAHQGEGLGNQFLSHIREVDAIIEIVRNFTDKNVSHVHGEINPQSDKEVINLELVMADLEIVKKRLEKIHLQLKGLPHGKAGPHDKTIDQLNQLLEKIKLNLEKGVLIKNLNLAEEEKILIKDLNLLTQKPIIYVLNIDETAIDKQEILKNIFPDEIVIPLSCKLEAELTDLDEIDAKKYLAELVVSGVEPLKIKESGLEKLIKESYQILNLITFYTFNNKETRAWTGKRKTLAPAAAGIIHTDFEQGFIRAEVINWQDLVNTGGLPQAKEKGLVRIEGKKYEVQDGDVIYFHFN